jgi:negative regulator of sigma E activity
MSNHPVQQEELMAYLDGELAPDRATTAAAHLEHCRECQNVAGDLQSVSRRMMAWQVEPPDDPRMTQAIAAALEERDEAQKKSTASAVRSWRNVLRMPRLPRWAWGMAVVTFAALVFMSNSLFFYKAHESRQTPASQIMPRIDMVPLSADIGRSSGQHGTGAGSRKTVPEKESTIRFYNSTNSGNYGFSGDRGGSTIPSGPMIVRTASLTLTTKEFDKSEAGLEAILTRHGGYMGQLNVSAPLDRGRSLTATLRVPSDQLDATLGELKKLGRVEGESQNGEEVTEQYVDLQARITNARNTEAQLTDILRNRTGKLSDVLTVEEEISRVRGEIERMEAERKNLAHLADFATVNTTLTEEYEDQLQAVPVSTFTRIRNAAVEGYTSVTEGVISVVLFLFAYGPSILVWGALVFFPVRAVWRRWRRRKSV